MLEKYPSHCTASNLLGTWIYFPPWTIPIALPAASSARESAPKALHPPWTMATALPATSWARGSAPNTLHPPWTMATALPATSLSKDLPQTPFTHLGPWPLHCQQHLGHVDLPQTPFTHFGPWPLH